METETAARLAALEAAHAQLRDDLAAVVDGAEVTLAQLQRRFIEAKRQLAAPDKPVL